MDSDKYQVDDQVWHQVRRQVVHKVVHQVDDQVWHQVRISTSNQVWSQVERKVLSKASAEP